MHLGLTHKARCPAVPKLALAAFSSFLGLFLKRSKSLFKCCGLPEKPRTDSLVCLYLVFCVCVCVCVRISPVSWKWDVLAFGSDLVRCLYATQTRNQHLHTEGAALIEQPQPLGPRPPDAIGIRPRFLLQTWEFKENQNKHTKKSSQKARGKKTQHAGSPTPNVSPRLFQCGFS